MHVCKKAKTTRLMRNLPLKDIGANQYWKKKLSEEGKKIQYSEIVIHIRKKDILISLKKHYITRAMLLIAILNEGTTKLQGTKYKSTPLSQLWFVNRIVHLHFPFIYNLFQYINNIWYNLYINIKLNKKCTASPSGKNVVFHNFCIHCSLKKKYMFYD